jgi:6-phosphogluconolactonase
MMFMNCRRMGQLLVLGIVLGYAGAASADEKIPVRRHTDLISAGKVPVYVGTYTRGTSKGIYLYHLDLASGALEPAGCAGEVANPSFLDIHPSRPLLYAVSEVNTFEGKKGGAVSAFAIDAGSGKLTLLNQQSSQGAGPCHVMVDPSGKCVVVANYTSGSAACLPIQDDGKLGEAASVVQHEGSSVNTNRQKGPHAHGVNMDAASRFAFVNDLGIDKVMIYRLDASQGKLSANDPPFLASAAGAGPRHLAFHPNGRYAYVINELNSTITALTYDAARGELKPLESISTLPEGYKGPSTAAEVEVHPSGKFVYGSNRGPDDMAIFAVDAATGKLRLVGHESTQGKAPRSFAIDPTGRYLLVANQDGNNIVVYRINAETGELHPVGSPAELNAPVCIKMPRVGR